MSKYSDDKDPADQKGQPHPDIDKNIAWWLKTESKIQHFYKEIEYGTERVLEPYVKIEVNDRQLKDEAAKIWLMNQKRRKEGKEEFPEYTIKEYKCINFIIGKIGDSEPCCNVSFHQEHQKFKVEVCNILNRFARKDYLQNKTNPNPWHQPPSEFTSGFHRSFQETDINWVGLPP